MLNKYNLSIAKLASKEISRYALGGILVTHNHTVVTDGHLMVVVSCPASEQTHPPFIMAAQDAAKIAAALPKNGDNPARRNAAVGAAAENGLVPVLTYGEEQQFYNVRPLSGSFPDFERVIPKASGNKFKITLDAKLLKDLMAQFETFCKGEKNLAVEFYFRTDSDAVRMDAQGGDGQHMTAVLMPMRPGAVTQLDREAAEAEGKKGKKAVA
jgi:DNA polymerase III sliding clamp (beta) subunit (PCNA family)